MYIHTHPPTPYCEISRTILSHINGGWYIKWTFDGLSESSLQVKGHVWVLTMSDSANQLREERGPGHGRRNAKLHAILLSHGAQCTNKFLLIDTIRNQDECEAPSQVTKTSAVLFECPRNK